MHNYFASWNNYVAEFLSCLCDKLVAKSLIDNKGTVLTKEDIQPISNIPDEILNYPLMPYRSYFTDEAWEYVKEIGM